jgi:hypothetical protein
VSCVRINIRIKRFTLARGKVMKNYCCRAGIGFCLMLLFQAATAQNSKLEAQDYVDIRNLIDTYPHLLDNCRNNGNDYADLFTNDATFGVSSQWGGPVKVWFRGREQIRRAGGGGETACVNRPNYGYHLNINPHIYPTASGAAATSTLLTIINDTDRRGDVVHWEGGYEDTFEKTAAGWKFKSRVHVWSEVAWTDNPADMPPRNLEEE